MGAAGVRRIVFSSTCATYGVPGARRPSPRTIRRTRSAPTARSKLAFERALLDHARGGGLRAHRPALLQRGRLPPATARWARTTTAEEHLVPLAIDAALGPQPGAHHLRRRLRHARRHLRPRLHPRAGPGPRARAGAGGGRPRRAPSRPSTWAASTGYSVRRSCEAVERVAGRPVPAHGRPPPPGRPAAAGGAPRARPRAARLPRRRSGLDAIVRPRCAGVEAHPHGSWRRR